MRLAILNMKYSPNLGDGVIAECLEASIRDRTGWKVVSVDLAGRTAYPTPRSGRVRLAALLMLKQLPQRLRDTAVRLVLTRQITTKLVPRWHDALRDADFAVIGGGQLIQAFDLNFPLKLTAATTLCENLKIGTALFAVGATAPSSATGERLFRKVLASEGLVYASARDESSLQILSNLGRPATLDRDPGLLAATTWPAPPRDRRERPLVGVGIAHPVVLAYHSSRDRRLAVERTLNAYVKLIQGLATSGCDVIVFSNGAGEDEDALKAVRRRLAGSQGEHEPRIQFPPRASTPGELCRLIAGVDCLVAHRLHANIVAYSYAIPAIGLAWDRKMEAFFLSVGRERYLLSLQNHEPEAIISLVHEALAEGVEPEQHARTITETADAIDRLVAVIGEACASRSTAAAPRKSRFPHRPQAPPPLRSPHVAHRATGRT
jgi:polysaccharide pyruvyl transferase WcaK-like protein